MSENSKIEWTDHTFNPWEGCAKVGTGCDRCYAETRNARYAGGAAINWGPGAPRRRTSSANWRKPLAWNKAHAEFFAAHGRRQRVFCASLADIFDNEVDPAWRADLFALIEATPNLDWLLLTKRIGNASSMILDVISRLVYGNSFSEMATKTKRVAQWPWPNVWLGATIVNQGEADRDIPKLLAVPAARRFLSMEPLLGPVDLTHIRPTIFTATANALTGKWKWDGGPLKHEAPPLDWVIVGGESGPGARPMHPYWARDLRDQCAAAGVSFLFKQWGEWLPGGHYTTELAIKDSNPTESKYLCALWTGATWNVGRFGPDEIHFEAEPMYLVGKKASGRELYGRTHDEFPEAV